MMENISIGSGEYLFITKWSECGDKSIYAYNDFVKKNWLQAWCRDIPH